MSDNKLSHRRPFGSLLHDSAAFDREFQRMGEDFEDMRAHVDKKLSSTFSPPEEFEDRKAQVSFTRSGMVELDRLYNIPYRSPGMSGHCYLSNPGNRPPLNQFYQYVDESHPKLAEANRLRRELYDAMLDYEFKRGLLVAPNDRWDELLEHEKLQQHKAELEKARANNTFDASRLAEILRDYKKAKKKYKKAKKAVIDFEKNI